MTTTPHDNALTQDTIDRVAAALEGADIGHSMKLTRLIDGVHTYTLTINGKIEDFTDNDDNDAVDQVYARIREVKHRLRAEAVIAALHAPIPEAGNGDGWMDISSAPKDSPIVAISWQEGYGSFESKWSRPEVYEWDEAHSYWANRQRGTCIWPQYQHRYRCKSLGHSPPPPSIRSSDTGRKG